mmetsp:Transcript_19926/g.54956  ORF Transcript_19926/g.54956 Transcript_19926/m.54956 type:complete len:300 (+) Transcript_19926:2526-3425(+)
MISRRWHFARSFGAATSARWHGRFVHVPAWFGSVRVGRGGSIEIVVVRSRSGHDLRAHQIDIDGPSRAFRNSRVQKDLVAPLTSMHSLIWIRNFQIGSHRSLDTNNSVFIVMLQVGDIRVLDVQQLGRITLGKVVLHVLTHVFHTLGWQTSSFRRELFRMPSQKVNKLVQFLFLIPNDIYLVAQHFHALFGGTLTSCLHIRRPRQVHIGLGIPRHVVLPLLLNEANTLQNIGNVVDTSLLDSQILGGAVQIQSILGGSAEQVNKLFRQLSEGGIKAGVSNRGRRGCCAIGGRRTRTTQR